MTPPKTFYKKMIIYKICDIILLNGFIETILLTIFSYSTFTRIMNGNSYWRVGDVPKISIFFLYFHMKS